MNSDTLLLRQVSPSWVQDGRVTSQVFRPTAKDEKRLSVYDGDLIGAEEAWRHYTRALAFRSMGVLAVAVRECEAHDLPTASEPGPFPSHVVISFEAFSSSQIEKKAMHLRKAAVARGWQYVAEADG